MNIFPRIRNRSAAYASNRMKHLLTSDRIHCSQQKINLLKQDILQTVKRYFRIQEEEATIEISQDSFILHIRIPVIKLRNEDL